MDIAKTKSFAEKEFSKMSELDKQWNILHASHIIKAIGELLPEGSENFDKLAALAWVHDIGKTKSDENHAELSVEILEKAGFELDDIDKDCIINHGSSGKPQTKEGEIFRYADGLSLFYPEMVKFYVYANVQEGKSVDEANQKIEKQYGKYLKAYKDNPKAIELLNKKWGELGFE